MVRWVSHVFVPGQAEAGWLLGEQGVELLQVGGVYVGGGVELHAGAVPGEVLVALA